MTDEHPRVLVVGGSIIHGLGHSGAAVGELLGESLGASEVLNLAASSQTSEDIIARHLPAIAEYEADIAVVMLGGAESLVRPSHRVQNAIERHAPAAWHGVAGLDPRAVYSRSSWSRRLRQRATSLVKVMLKHLLFFVAGGGKPRVAFAAMARDVAVVARHIAEHSTLVVFVGLPDADPRLFPGTRSAFRQADALVQAIAETLGNAIFVSAADEIDAWADYLDDHLHLNGAGHAKLSELVRCQLTERIAA